MCPQSFQSYLGVVYKTNFHCYICFTNLERANICQNLVSKYVFIIMGHAWIFIMNFSWMLSFPKNHPYFRFHNPISIFFWYMVQFWKSSVCRIKIICLYVSWHQASRYPSIGPSRISRYLNHFIQQWTAQFRMVIQLRATEELLCQLLNDKIIVFVDFYMIFLAQAKWCHFTHSKLLPHSCLL